MLQILCPNGKRFRRCPLGPLALEHGGGLADVVESGHHHYESLGLTTVQSQLIGRERDEFCPCGLQQDVSHETHIEQMGQERMTLAFCRGFRPEPATPFS